MQRLFRPVWRLIAALLLPLPWLTPAHAQDAPPVIESDPATQTVNAGQNVTLAVGATGAPPLTYRWWFGTREIPDATTNILTLDNVNALNAGSYVAVVANLFGAATSAPAVLTVIGPPVITAQPTNQSVYPGQSATFGVSAVSSGAPTYQWQFLGSDLPDATNQTLTVANVTTNNAGAYAVRVGNNNGSITSRSAQLTVLALPQPALRLGVLTVTNGATVPVLYTAFGTETNLSFSVDWDPMAYGFAGFTPALDPGPGPEATGAAGPRPAGLPDATVVSLDESQLDAGRLGVSLAWTPGTSLDPGESTIAQIQFQPAGGETLYAGRLGLADEPVPAIVAPPIEGTNTVILGIINPQVILAGAPVLDRQTGFLQQEIEFANPGRALAFNARLTVMGLGVDANTNAVSLANAQGFLLPDFVPYVDFGAIAPAEIRKGLLQYYVTDRRTVPTPSFDMTATPTVNFPVPPGTVLQAQVRRTNGLVLVEFPTVPIRRYYIQYASSLTHFLSGNVETSLPPVTGTGSNLQWVDTGPPRTQPEPADGDLRLYRVLEVQ